VRQFVNPEFERVALVQIGDRQKEFCDAYAGELGEALKSL
jgi:hypothetical protein